MANPKPPGSSTALRRLGSGGVSPDMAAAAPLANRLSARDFEASLDQLWPRLRGPFDTILAAEKGSGSPSTSPEAPPDLEEMDLVDAKALLGFLQVQTLAYGGREGTPERALMRAQQVFDALGQSRAWSTSNLYELIEPKTLKLPRGGYSYGGCGSLFSDATFEETVILLSPARAVIVMWTDED